MIDLSTKYLGLELKNPIIVGSCGLTNSLDMIKDLANCNAGAVVLKSLFEEQILAELKQNIENYNTSYPEAFDYVREYTRDNVVSEYLTLIEQSKKNVDIPVIASINCVSSDEWVSFAKSVEQAGADALEINISVLPTDPKKRCVEYENVYFDVIDKLGDITNIPISLKMSKFSTSLASLISRLSWTGKVSGFVLFNRYYRPDFNIDTLKVHSAQVLSTPEELATPLRWVALLANQIQQDFAASTGAHDSRAVIKQLLAGAQAVQVVSALYKHGPSYLTELVKGVEEWMGKKGFSTIDEFRGMLGDDGKKDSSALQRIQYMKYFAGIE